MEKQTREELYEKIGDSVLHDDVDAIYNLFEKKLAEAVERERKEFLRRTFNILRYIETNRGSTSERLEVEINRVFRQIEKEWIRLQYELYNQEKPCDHNDTRTVDKQVVCNDCDEILKREEL